MQVPKVLLAVRCKYRTQKSRQNRHLGTIAELRRAISSKLRHVSTIGKKIIKQQYLLDPHVLTIRLNFGPLAAEIVSLVWGTPRNFNAGFRILQALLHGTVYSGRQPNFAALIRGAPPIFGRAAITLGSGPHF